MLYNFYIHKVFAKGNPDVFLVAFTFFITIFFTNICIALNTYINAQEITFPPCLLVAKGVGSGPRCQEGCHDE